MNFFGKASQGAKIWSNKILFIHSFPDFYAIFRCSKLARLTPAESKHGSRGHMLSALTTKWDYFQMDLPGDLM